ncbi:hypothetical protein QQ045_028537 [Rhodiola kirilowii]
MMQPEFLNSFSPFGYIDSGLNNLEINNLLVDLEFLSPRPCGESGIFSPSSFLSSDFIESQSWDKEFLFEFPNEEFQLEQYLCNEADELSIDTFSSQKNWIAEFNEASPCSVLSSCQATMTNAPHQEMDENNELSLFHLLKAYAEATEKEQTTLMEVIQRCISDKASPIGETMERVAFNLFKASEPQYSYIKQESRVNFSLADKAFYKLFPYGRFAHLAANSAILEALPADAETVNIVDFDISDGVQWAPLIETLSHQNKEVTLMSVKWAEDDLTGFENTRKRLISHARSVGAKLKVQEVEMEELVSELKRTNKRRSAQTQWCAFNCMVSLPHMVKNRSKAKVHEFLRLAKDVLNDSTNVGQRGIITCGDGEADMKLTNLSSYSFFFETQIAHYQTLMKSIECTLPDQFVEAKLAIESLFLAPHISSHGWRQKWEDMNEVGDFRAIVGLEGLRLSQNTLMEANQLVRGGANSYSLRMGRDVNEMVLEWRGTSLVKLSTWR